MATKWQRFDVKIPKEFRKTTLIAKDIIEHIKKRSEDGVGVRAVGNNVALDYDWPKYSKEYINSLDFKIAGKNKNRIDLTLTGDMLASIEYLKKKKDNVLQIGFKRGDQENGKADGNIRGTYGNPSPIRGKKRNFLGITTQELKEILSKYKKKFGKVKGAITPNR